MMKETFEQLVWGVVDDERDSTLVVDNFHAYAIIKNRLDSFWEHVRQLEPDGDTLPLLGGLVATSAYAQLAAEALGLVRPQLTADDRHQAAEDAADKARNAFRSLVHTIIRDKKAVRPIQRGTPRFAFEFDEDVLLALQRQAFEDI